MWAHQGECLRVSPSHFDPLCGRPRERNFNPSAWPLSFFQDVTPPAPFTRHRMFVVQIFTHTHTLLGRAASARQEGDVLGRMRQQRTCRSSALIRYLLCHHLLTRDRASASWRHRDARPLQTLGAAEPQQAAGGLCCCRAGRGLATRSVGCGATGRQTMPGVNESSPLDMLGWAARKSWHGFHQAGGGERGGRRDSSNLQF